MQRIIAFFMAIIAFFANLFGFKCHKNDPPDPPTITEPTEPISEPTDPVVREFTVTFKDDNGGTLLTLTLPEGEMQTRPARSGIRGLPRARFCDCFCHHMIDCGQHDPLCIFLKSDFVHVNADQSSRRRKPQWFDQQKNAFRNSLSGPSYSASQRKL